MYCVIDIYLIYIIYNLIYKTYPHIYKFINDTNLYNHLYVAK